jgi:hypothetical protein
LETEKDAPAALRSVRSVQLLLRLLAAVCDHDAQVQQGLCCAFRGATVGSSADVVLFLGLVWSGCSGLHMNIVELV